MSAIKVFCIEKHRNSSGAIVEYVMGDKLGDTMTFDRKEIKKLIKDKKYDVVNLQIDSLGRVVDKEMKDEKATIDGINNKSKSNNINDVFDRAYGWLMKQGDIIIICKPSGQVVMTEPFDKLDSKTDVDKLQAAFEGYVAKKYNARLLKIDAKNNRTNRRYICYGIGYVEDFPSPEEIRDAESVSHYTIKCTGASGRKRVVKIKSKSGEIINDAYLGTILYDENNQEAVEWAKKRMRDLEKATAHMTVR